MRQKLFVTWIVLHEGNCLKKKGVHAISDSVRPKLKDVFSLHFSDEDTDSESSEDEDEEQGQTEEQKQLQAILQNALEIP